MKKWQWNRSFFLLLFIISGVPPLGAQGVEGFTQFSLLSQAMQEKVKSIPLVPKSGEEGRPLPEIRFFVKKIVVEGNDALTDKMLEKITKPFENRELSFQELKRLASGIEREYLKHGYLTCFAYIPPQSIRDGLIQVRVIEGRIGYVFIEGNRYFEADKILSYVNFNEGEFLKSRKLEEVLALLNENQDRHVRAILRPGPFLGSTDLVLDVQDTFPFHTGASWDNHGGEFSGRTRLGLFARHNNATAKDDTLFGGVFAGRDFYTFAAQYLLPLPPLKGKLFGGWSRAIVRPEKHYKRYKVHAVSTTYSLGVQKTLKFFKWSFCSVQIGAQAVFDFKQNETRVLDQRYLQERFRVLRLSPSLKEKDRLGKTELTNDFSLGLPAFGATVRSVEQDSPQPDFFRTQLSLVRHQKMPWGTQAVLKMVYQYSGQGLPSQEALPLGGASSVRGYPESDFLAETGLLISLEYVTPLFLMPSAWHLPYLDQPLKDRFNFVAFFDQGSGQAYSRSQQRMQVRYLLGAGCGLRLRLWGDLYARTEWGLALGDVPLTASEKSQLHFRLQFEI